MKSTKHALRIWLIGFSVIAYLLNMTAGVAVSEVHAEAKKLTDIESIISTGDGSDTELTIRLSSPATYTFYKNLSPPRLIIDFSQVTSGTISAPVIVNKGNFKSVVAHQFNTDAGMLTRIEIDLVHDNEPQIGTLPGNPEVLKISFPAPVEAGAAPVAAPAVVATNPVPAEPPVAIPDAKPEISNEVAYKTLSAITVANHAIILTLDGLVSDIKTFRLNKPERYVVDLMNVKSALPTRLLQLNASGVASARIGVYPDKVRVVFDGVNESFPEATAAKTDTGVVITLNAKPVDIPANSAVTPVPVEKPPAEKEASVGKTAAAPSVPPAEKPVAPAVIPVEVKPEVKPESVQKQDIPETKSPAKVSASPTAAGRSDVEMIDFQVIDGISRVSVKVNGTVTVDQPVKTPGFVTLTLKNSLLPKKLQRSLETRAFISPVLRITPLSVKTRKGTDTKIRIATRYSTSFTYRQEGDMLYIDFKHHDSLPGDKLAAEVNSQKNRAALEKPAPSRDEEMATDLSPIPEAADYKPTGTPYRSYKGRKVSLEFADAEVRKIFQLLSEVSNKNFVLGDEVTGAISLKLVNVPWDQALDIILDTKGLDKREEGNIILIKGKGKFRSQAEEELDIKKTQLKNEPLYTEYFSINYSKSGIIKPQVEALITANLGRVGEDERTNTLIVTAIRSDIARIKNYLAIMDVPERQVMIEARIVEASSTFSQNLGVSWGLHYKDGAASFAGINQLDNSFGGLTSAPVTSGQSGVAGTSMGISFGRLASNVQLDMRLNAAASIGQIKIVSTPKIATLNNKTAKITQGQSIPYQNTTSTNGAVTQFVQAVLSLEVKPHINANGTIGMEIKATNNSAGTGSPPPINTKEATTEMLLKDGETTVIGGIYVDTDTVQDDGVPYLMDIPLLGRLFKSSATTKVKSELLIFITPRILN